MDDALHAGGSTRKRPSSLHPFRRTSKLFFSSSVLTPHSPSNSNATNWNCPCWRLILLHTNIYTAHNVVADVIPSVVLLC